MQQQEPTQLRQTSPKKSRASTAKKSNTKRQGSVTTATITSGPISQVYVQRGINETNVELEHLRTLNPEVERERTVTVSVQDDNAMLRA